LFLALPRLRRLASAEEESDTLHVPGGQAGLWAVTVVGGAATLVSLALVFLPPPGTQSVLNYEVNLIVQAGMVLAAGFLLYRRRSRQAS
jgi:hypothetical protein